MTKLIHRLKQFIDYKGLSMRKFDLSIGASDGYTQRTFKNDGSIGSDLVEKIIATYTEINPYWLIAGEGEMLRSNLQNNHVLEEGGDYETDFFELSLLKYLDKPRIKEKILKIIDDERKEEETN